MSEELRKDLGGTLKLRRHGSFFVSSDLSVNCPRFLMIEGHQWYRFMDRIFSPIPVSRLPPELVSELCDLRLALSELVIQDVIHRKVTVSAIEAGVRYCASARRILDFGTGDGRSLANIRRSFAQATVIGCDMSESAVRRASKRGTVFHVSPYGPLPFANGSFDLVLCIFVFHFAIPESMLTELRRSLAPDGYLVSSLYGTSSLTQRFKVRRAGFEHETSVPALGTRSHWIDVWRSS
jgi:SAM-dependent methyltransferase